MCKKLLEWVLSWNLYHFDFASCRGGGEAKQAYLRALELDHQRLSEVMDPEKESDYRWSLGKTFFAMGRKESAKEAITRAANITRVKHKRNMILRWFEGTSWIADFLFPFERANEVGGGD